MSVKEDANQQATSIVRIRSISKWSKMGPVVEPTNSIFRSKTKASEGAVLLGVRVVTAKTTIKVKPKRNETQPRTTITTHLCLSTVQERQKSVSAVLIHFHSVKKTALLGEIHYVGLWLKTNIAYSAWICESRQENNLIINHGSKQQKQKANHLIKGNEYVDRSRKQTKHLNVGIFVPCLAIIPIC